MRKRAPAKRATDMIALIAGRGIAGIFLVLALLAGFYFIGGNVERKEDID